VTATPVFRVHGSETRRRPFSFVAMISKDVRMPGRSARALRWVTYFLAFAFQACLEIAIPE